MSQNERLEEVWRVEYSNRLFDQLICVRGTEEEMRQYMESEFGFVGRYSACTGKELDAIGVLNIPIYIAPRLS